MMSAPCLSPPRGRLNGVGSASGHNGVDPVILVIAPELEAAFQEADRPDGRLDVHGVHAGTRLDFQSLTQTRES